MRKTYIFLLILAFIFTGCNNSEQAKIEVIEKQLKQKENDFIAKNKEVERLKIEQQRQLEAQQKLLTEKRISEITKKLDFEYKKIGKLLEERSKINGFQLLRSSKSKQKQLNEVQQKIDECLLIIDENEREMKKINPNWVVENQIEEVQEVH